MRKNPERRLALIDAAIEVLAREGARGLTFRAVDTQAAVPNGTASNYFSNRDDLLTQAGGRIYERLIPDDLAGMIDPVNGTDRERLVTLMLDVVERVTSFGTGFLALMELRLEATRRPDLRAVLTVRIREDFDLNVANHLASGVPGDAMTVRLLYLSLNWLVLDRLTLPNLFGEEDIRTIVEAAVDRALPRES
ncbi:TetR/AcrR family transcriptional regulator [Rhodococcus erythropolis]|uniref:TetR/AcrR family transcriptional regulator n=1 Tax=Rhodococcus TaxID=1827 RepID=UPI000BB3570F|nr:MULTISPECIES: TetR/AcrR family transcriptional regulator [Rhodococcus]NHP13221.1 TetR family transcriptional regulator [Rhodococcus sp. IC4_135]MBJ7480657.1 TetR family transcriptional regulator [Rhodococcus sp. (in: high G+C Gram-positive bacteria)]PBJ00950.1 transcriptional regulator BetI [Rhodococcus erythropolis]QQM22335.1 TetR family transcriptional regulator [Rhodococcus sp. P-2]RQO51799.1 TetR family transcriptional regulator [Rhodococcus sp. KBW08]